MGRTIDHYFAPISGYAYLGFPKLVRIASEMGAHLNHRPVDIARVFAASETTPPAKQSDVRRAYRTLDMQRHAAREGLAMNIAPKHWPAPCDLACRVLSAVELLGANVETASMALLRGCWASDLDVANAAQIEAILAGVDLDGPSIMSMAETPEADDLADSHTQAAIDAGVFGSPTYVVEGELFWGQDRLDLVAEAARREAA